MPTYQSLLLIVCILFPIVLSQEKLSIYQEFTGYPCTTLANEFGWIGCRSSKSGQYGTLWPIQTDDDVSTFSSTSGDKVGVFWPESFSRTNVETLIDTGRLQAVILLSHKDVGKPTKFQSPDPPYPLSEFGCLNPPCTWDWNVNGANFSYQGYKIPMWALTDVETSSQIRQLALENKNSNEAYPQWSARIKSFMDSGADSFTCLSRSDCQGVGGKSIWSAVSNVDNSRDFILSVAPLDSNDFFHDLAVGADSTWSAVIANILAADAISRMPDRLNLTKQPIFAFFAAESWGFQGSRQFVNDIVSFSCNTLKGDGCSDPYATSLEFQKININKISAIIELDQIGNIENTRDLYIHTEDSANSNFIATKLKDIAKNPSINFTLSPARTPASVGIPPLPLVSFLKQKKSIPSLVLAGYADHFKKFYHSRYDDEINSTQVALSGLLLARTIYELAGGLNSNDLSVDFQKSADLVYCLTQNFTCPLMLALNNLTTADPNPNAYTSVYRKTSLLQLTALFVRYAMYNYTATVRTGTACTTKSDCTTGECIQSECIISNTFWHEAPMPGIVKNSDGDYQFVNTQVSTWTESDWGALKAEIYLTENPVVEWIILVLGVIHLAVSFVVIFYGTRWLTQRLKGA